MRNVLTHCWKSAAFMLGRPLTLALLRTNQIEWSCLPPALPLPFADLPDAALNGVSSRGPEDPSDQRPLVNRRAAQRLAN